MDKKNPFEWAIRSEQELREYVGAPHKAVANKAVSVIDSQCKRFIEKSPILFLSTCDADGKCDVSPRGDHPGFVHILDEKRLLIPDRPGNRRVDSMMNIISNPQVGLLFLIPGMEWVLRINGRACVVKTAELMGSSKEETPVLSIAVEVEEVFVHCPRALKKSGVWKMDSWPSLEDVPSGEEMFRAHLKLNGMTLEE